MRIHSFTIRRYRGVLSLTFATILMLSGVPPVFATQAIIPDSQGASENALVNIAKKVSFINGGFVDKSGEIQMNNATTKFSEPIPYSGGDLMVKGLSGTNAALILFFKGGELLQSVGGVEYNDKSTFFEESRIPEGTTHFVVNASVEQDAIIKIRSADSLKWNFNQSGLPLGMDQSSKTGRYQFGATANYDVSNIPVQEAFKFRDSLEIYALYDGLMAAHPLYISRIDLDLEAREQDISKPDALEIYNFYMYRFRPTYTPVGVNHHLPQNYNEIKVMIVTGTHDEPYAVETAYNLMKRICENWHEDVNAEEMRYNVTFYIIPCGNPWAFSQPQAGGGGNIRTNHNGVDLNRNMPSKDWTPIPIGRTYSGPTAGSEYESQILKQQIDKIEPTVFIDFHNYGTDLKGHLFYALSRGKDGFDVISEVLSKNSRTLKKLNSDYPQDAETILGWMQKNVERGTREAYANEQGAFAFTYECCPGYVWNDGVLGTSLKRAGDGIVMRDNLVAFSYFLLRVLNEVSLRKGVVE